MWDDPGTPTELDTRGMFSGLTKGTKLVTRPQSLPDYHLQVFEERMNSGYYRVGEKLPSETELATEMGVSRPMVRELLGRLRERGYIETFNGRGSFVRAQTSETMVQAILRHIEFGMGVEYTADDLYDVRRTIEVEAARTAASRADENDLRVIRLHLNEMRVAKNDPEPYTVADMNFHFAVARATKNPLFLALLRPISEVIARGILESVSTYREGMPGGIAGHEEVMECLISRDPQGAAAAMRTHMDYSRSTYPEGLTRADEGSAPEQ